jgi:hypothetical protein
MFKAAVLFIGDTVAILLLVLSGFVALSGFELMLKLRESALGFPMTLSVGIAEVCIGILMLAISLSYLKRTARK